MNISFNATSRRCEIQCGESLTIYEVAEIRGGVLPFIKEAKEYFMNLSQTEEIDTAGVQLLIALHKQSESDGGYLKLDGCNPQVKSTLLIFNVPFLESSDHSSASCVTDS